MAEETGTWIAAGESPLSSATEEWLADEPVRGTPQEVIERIRSVASGDRRQRERSQWLAQLREKAEDGANAVRWFPRPAAVPGHVPPSGVTVRV